MRIVPGPLANIDWLYQVRNGRGFTRGYALAASVGDINQIQLFNPAGSGITAFLRYIEFSTQTTGSMNVAAFDTALTDDRGAVFNVLLGGAAGKCHIRTSQPAAGEGDTIYQMRLLADRSLRPFGEWFAVLDAGEGILIRPGATNVWISGQYQLVEL